MNAFKRCLILTMVILLSACADKRPVLYPNAHLKKVGHAAAQADIDACIQYAVDNEAAGNKGEEIAKSTAGGATRGILKSGDPDPVFKNFVNRCLKEKGYDPIGWR